MAERTVDARAVERMLLQLECSPWHAIHRVAIGFAILAVYHGLPFARDWRLLLLTFAAVLLSLRIAPAIARRVLPFSVAAQAAWAERRRLGKRYDAYQWRKLLWIGVGMVIWLLLPGSFSPAPAALTAVCVVGGGIGAWRWNRRVAAATRRGARDWAVIPGPPRGA
jgi:hypothetical protein